MSNGDEPTVPITCPECDTTSRVPVEDVPDTVTRHNERHHDGEDVAGVDPAIRNAIADLAAEDLGLYEDDEEFDA